MRYSVIRDRACVMDIISVVVPGGPVEGTELAFDLSLLDIFPPQVGPSILRHCVSN